MKNYIPLPSDFYRQPGIIRMLRKEGCAGVGAYIMVVGWLRECDGYRCDLDEESIGIGAMVSDLSLIKRIINDYKLFQRDEEGYVYSPWLASAMASYDGVREKRREAGKASAKARAETKKGTFAEQVFSNDETKLSICSTLNNKYNSINQQNAQTNKAESDSAKMWCGLSESEIDTLCRDTGEQIPIDRLEWTKNTYGAAHDAVAITQMACRWHLTEKQYQFLYRITEKFRAGHAFTRALSAISRAAASDNFTPTFPMNYIIKKIKNNGK